MEIEWLRQIVELSKIGSFSRTAEKCFISQPALSKHVSAVEYSLGIQIFQRHGHRVSLTREGAQFVTDAQRVVADYDAAISKLSLSLKQRQRKLSIGYLDYVMHDQFLNIAQRIQRQHPGAVIEFVPFDAASVLTALREDRIELALLMLLVNKPPEKGLLFTAIRYQRNLAVLPASHPLANRDALNMRDLLNEHILTPSKDATIAAPLFSTLEAHGLKRHPDLHFSTFYDACLMIGTGAGVAFLPPYVKDYEAQLNIRCLPVLDADAPVNYFGCLWKRGNSNPLVKIFVDQCSSGIQSLNDKSE